MSNFTLPALLGGPATSISITGDCKDTSKGSSLNVCVARGCRYDLKEMNSNYKTLRLQLDERQENGAWEAVQSGLQRALAGSMQVYIAYRTKIEQEYEKLAEPI